MRSSCRALRRARTAVLRVTRSTRSDSTAPSLRLRGAGPAAVQRGAGGADRVQVVVLAPAASIRPVRTVDLEDLDTGLGQVPGDAGAVAAGALHADPADVTEATAPSGSAPDTRPGWWRSSAWRARSHRCRCTAATCRSLWVSIPPTTTGLLAPPLAGVEPAA